MGMKIKILVRRGKNRRLPMLPDDDCRILEADCSNLSICCLDELEITKPLQPLTRFSLFSVRTLGSRILPDGSLSDKVVLEEQLHSFACVRSCDCWQLSYNYLDAINDAFRNFDAVDAIRGTRLNRPRSTWPLFPTSCRSNVNHLLRKFAEGAIPRHNYNFPS